MIYELLLRNLTNSIYGGLLVAIVVLIRLAVRRRVSKSYICILWILVGLRLIIPASIESPVGILPQISLGHSMALKTEDYYYRGEPTGPVFDESDGSSAHGIEGTAAEMEISVQGDAEYITVVPARRVKIHIPEIVWLTGCVLMLGYMAITWMIAGRNVRFAVPESFRIHIHPSDVTDSEVRIYSTEDIRVPFLFGLVKPKIYLPDGLSENDRIHVIACSVLPYSWVYRSRDRDADEINMACLHERAMLKEKYHALYSKGKTETASCSGLYRYGTVCRGRCTLTELC